MKPWSAVLWLGLAVACSSTTVTPEREGSGGSAGTGGSGAASGGGSGGATQRDAGADATTPDAADCASPLVFYVDSDSDGFGNPSTPVVACTAPLDHVDNGDDCFDNNPDVHPGQTAFFDSDRGDKSYDYDCDGIARTELNATGTCGTLLCNVTPGWVGLVPGCGEQGPWLVDCQQLVTCSQMQEQRLQACN